ncbi:nucleotide-binding universal stress UspA family protein [Winogradskyella epiphytica]|uniref:Nucleotide-binding universal stress UspA family protein n=1 Tax=Winogradskyella epiphytica TaxID=262005 RepID=A0A2V4XCD8_9FLAO|nr:universal stress protein [Winogradskyella epiphytica]PYE80151.1 nucleotide-binding universal stress UspA family protein [Winogradskyella epiphytica]GGW71686.1 universal stress protein UspA [Winogradskyella epiphytica]
MRHKILLPTDFSKNSIKAINYARELYKDDFCDFYLLNVFTLSGNILKNIMNLEPGNHLYETAKLNSENGLAKVFEMITMSANYNSKHRFEVMSTSNTVVEAVKSIVDQKDIDLVVMGTKGKTDSAMASFGSVAIQIMEKVRNCPVIVVPHSADLKLPKEIVFPTDYKLNYKRRELSYLTNIAKSCNATIIVLHILEQDELDKAQKENKKLLEEILKGTQYKFHNLPNSSVMTAVNIFVESRSSDMVAFINRKHPFFGSILSNPMVKKISFHLNVPILTMHDLKN